MKMLMGIQYSVCIFPSSSLLFCCVHSLFLSSAKFTYLPHCAPCIRKIKKGIESNEFNYLAVENYNINMKQLIIDTAKSMQNLKLEAIQQSEVQDQEVRELFHSNFITTSLERKALTIEDVSPNKEKQHQWVYPPRVDSPQFGDDAFYEQLQQSQPSNAKEKPAQPMRPKSAAASSTTTTTTTTTSAPATPVKHHSTHSEGKHDILTSSSTTSIPEPMRMSPDKPRY